MIDVVAATITAHISEDVFLRAGELYEADHPTVKAHPQFFTKDLESLEGFVHRKPVPDIAGRDIEQATAAPGEKRTTKRA